MGVTTIHYILERRSDPGSLLRIKFYFLVVLEVKTSSKTGLWKTEEPSRIIKLAASRSRVPTASTFDWDS